MSSRYEVTETAKGYAVSFTDIFGRVNSQRFRTLGEANQWAARLAAFEAGQQPDEQGRIVTTTGAFVYAV